MRSLRCAWGILCARTPDSDLSRPLDCWGPSLVFWCFPFVQNFLFWSAVSPPSGDTLPVWTWRVPQPQGVLGGDSLWIWGDSYVVDPSRRPGGSLNDKSLRRAAGPIEVSLIHGCKVAGTGWTLRAGTCFSSSCLAGLLWFTLDCSGVATLTKTLFWSAASPPSGDTLPVWTWRVPQPSSAGSKLTNVSGAGFTVCLLDPSWWPPGGA